MQVTRPNAQEPTPAEAKELEAFKSVIERAIADGKLTYDEIQTIQAAELGRKKVSADQLYRELELYRTLVLEKIEKGELEYGD